MQFHSINLPAFLIGICRVPFLLLFAVLPVCLGVYGTFSDKNKEWAVPRRCVLRMVKQRTGSTKALTPYRNKHAWFQQAFLHTSHPLPLVALVLCGRHPLWFAVDHCMLLLTPGLPSTPIVLFYVVVFHCVCHAVPARWFVPGWLTLKAHGLCLAHFTAASDTILLCALEGDTSWRKTGLHHTTKTCSSTVPFKQNLLHLLPCSLRDRTTTVSTSLSFFPILLICPTSLFF